MLTVTSHPRLSVSGTSESLDGLVNCLNSLTASLTLLLPSTLEFQGSTQELYNGTNSW